MKKIAYDSMKLDQLKIVEDSKCCLKVNAVITKEGVYKYPDGRAFKTRMELLKATRTARNAKITVLDHPDSMVVMSQSQIKGVVEKPFFDRNKIRATLNFDKNVCTSDFLSKVRIGKLKDVSIGFYYTPDFTSGKWNGKSYDYVMRDMVIDHVAAGVLKGRCSYPQCGIGVDTMMRRISYQEDKVVKRGSQWCVVHCHPDGSIGETIKCFPTKEKAEAMHRAIQARKHGSINDSWVGKYLFGDQDRRPPKDWMDNCKRKAESFADDPGAFCGDIWYNKPELRASFGGSSVSIIGGMNENMSLEEMYYPERSKEFNECVTQRMADGMTRGEAEAHCLAATKPEQEPTPPGGTLDAEEQTPYQKCIAKEMEAGATMEEASEKCKEQGTPKTDQDAAFENCVARKKEEGKSQEEAEKECRAEHPVAEEDQEPEKTPMERCIASRMEATEDTEEEARAWCEAELAGEHEAADTLIEHSNKLMKLKQQSDIEERRRRIRKL